MWSTKRCAPVSASRRGHVGARYRKRSHTHSGSGPGLISTSSTNLPTNSRPRPTRRASGPGLGLARQRGMILPDVNVLVHAHNADSAVHQRARDWWDECLSGAEGVGLAWAALLGFIRLTTNRRIVSEPLPVHDVMARIESW